MRGSQYDTKSVMQYSGTAFSKNGKKTIKALTGERISGYMPLSPGDVVELNAVYHCASE